MDLKHSGSGAVESADSYIAASKSTDMITPKEKESKNSSSSKAAMAPAEGQFKLRNHCDLSACLACKAHKRILYTLDTLDWHTCGSVCVRACVCVSCTCLLNICMQNTLLKHTHTHMQNGAFSVSCSSRYAIVLFAISVICLHRSSTECGFVCAGVCQCVCVRVSVLPTKNKTHIKACVFAFSMSCHKKIEMKQEKCLKQGCTNSRYPVGWKGRANGRLSSCILEERVDRVGKYMKYTNSRCNKD